MFMRTCSVVGLVVLGAISQSARADFSNAFAFGQPPEMVLAGTAAFPQYYATVTDGGDQRGALWYNVKQDAIGGFRGTIDFRINTPTLNGDGFAIVFHNDPRGFNQLGGGGSDLGYGDGFTNLGESVWIENGVALEVDTFSFGAPGEFDATHVSLQGMKDGSTRIGAGDAESLGHALVSDFGLELTDSGTHTLYFHYVAPTLNPPAPGEFIVNIDGTVLFTVNNIDLNNVNGQSIFDEDGKTWVGITGATGLADSTHAFDTWAFNGSAGDSCLAPYNHSGYGSGCGLGCFTQFGESWVGDQPMTFQWFKNGLPMTDDDNGRLTGLQTQTLTINQPSNADFGFYKLVVTNPCGERTNGEAAYYGDPAACNDIDFNNNGVFPEDADVIDFFSVLAGADCPNQITQCDPIDFNNNGVFPEDQDVIDFFTVLAGGPCP
jgi:hypothetical protein